MASSPASEPHASSPAERRGGRRAACALGCTLARERGNAITARTLDLGPGGMRVAVDRPLRVDEVLAFELAPEDGDGPPLAGRARVMREPGYGVYAMRFEGLDAAGRGGLEALVDRLSVD